MPAPDSEPDPDPDHVVPRGRSQRRWRWPSFPWWLAAVLVALLYVGVNVLYSWSTTRPEAPIIDSPDRVIVNLTPVGVVPMEDKIRLSVLIDPPDELLTGDGLTQQITVNLLSVPTDVTFERGSRALSTEIEVLASQGSFEMYPFDSYDLPVLATVTAQDDEGTKSIVPSEFVVWGKFPGWRVETITSRDIDYVELMQWGITVDLAEELDAGTLAITQVHVSRSGSTMSIVVLLLGAMIVLAGLGLVVARSVATRRRRIEATMASWFAALLFAMVPLRTNLPGAPPIGVWIDFLVFLWVLMALMVALSLFIGSWLRYSDPPARVSLPR